MWLTYLARRYLVGVDCLGERSPEETLTSPLIPYSTCCLVGCTYRIPEEALEPITNGYITIYCGQGGFACATQLFHGRSGRRPCLHPTGLFLHAPCRLLTSTCLRRDCQYRKSDSPFGTWHLVRGGRLSCPPPSLRSTSKCYSGRIHGRAKVKKKVGVGVRLWSRLHAGEECVHAVLYVACIHIGNRRGNVGKWLKRLL